MTCPDCGHDVPAGKRFMTHGVDPGLALHRPFLWGLLDSAWFPTLFVAVPVAAYGILLAVADAALKRLGLRSTDPARVLFTLPLADPRWKTRFAAVLSPGGRSAAAPDSESVEHLLNGIQEAAGRVSGPPRAREIGAAMLAAARQLAGAIEQEEREAAGLGAAAGPEEEQRLRERLQSLQAGASVSDEGRKLVGLVEKQLALLASLRERAEEARLRRARRLELLRTARLQLSALGASGPGSELSASDRLRALCAEMEQLGAGAAGTATCHGIADPLEDETAVQPGAQVPLVRSVPTRHA